MANLWVEFGFDNFIGESKSPSSLSQHFKVLTANFDDASSPTNFSKNDLLKKSGLAAIEIEPMEKTFAEIIFSLNCKECRTLMNEILCLKEILCSKFYHSFYYSNIWKRL